MFSLLLSGGFQFLFGSSDDGFTIYMYRSCSSLLLSANLQQIAQEVFYKFAGSSRNNIRIAYLFVVLFSDFKFCDVSWRWQLLVYSLGECRTCEKL